MPTYPKIAQLKTVEAFRNRLSELNLTLPVDDLILTATDGSPMAQPFEIGGFTVGNRWCIHPMEGWDAHTDGSPSEHTLRRWRNFGASGAKFIWGGEAAAVQPDGRANPRQTMAVPANREGLKMLWRECVSTHAGMYGDDSDLLMGLQLTHSGRFSRPHSKKLEPRIAYRHPLLDIRTGIAADDDVVWTDDDLHRLIDNYVIAAGLAKEAGFRFVDVKACHGYLLHEFLSARSRSGPFGGDLKGRANLLTTIAGRIQNEHPELMVMVRLSIFDTLPYQAAQQADQQTPGRPPAEKQPGEPAPYSHLGRYEWGFGVDADNPLEIDLTEPLELLGMLQRQGVAAVNLSCGSPYYNPHIQRPAIFPPSDGYQPPEDPLVGVARQLHAVKQCKAAYPQLPMVGTGYSYLQEYLPHVAQAAVREGWVDMVGLGRVVLSHWELPADTLATGRLTRKKICRTFSDCTTAPRNGIVSGCFPLDPYYKDLPEAQELKQAKKGNP